MSNFKKEDLLAFLYKASQNIYVFSDNKKSNKITKTRNPDKSTTVKFAEGEFSLVDNYFGGEPYSGKEVVFYKEKPIWIMTYYGYVTKRELINEVYSILFEALQNNTKDCPFRGPKEYSRCSMKYTFDFDGDYDKFRGVEKICQGEDILYEAFFAGGLVDVN